MRAELLDVPCVCGLCGASSAYRSDWGAVELSGVVAMGEPVRVVTLVVCVDCLAGRTRGLGVERQRIVTGLGSLWALGCAS